MKYIKFIIGLAFLAGVTAQGAQIIGWSAISASSSMQAKWLGTNYAVIPPSSRNGGDPLVTFLSATGTNAAATVVYFFATNKTTEAPLQTNSTTTITVVSTNGFIAGQMLLIQHSQTPNPLVSDRFASEPAIVSSVNANGTNVVLTAAPAASVLPGDLIWQLMPAGTLPVGNATVTFNGTGIVSGQRDTPFLFMEAGSTNTTINSVCAIAQSDTITEK